MHTAEEQHLGLEDVADARHHALVQQHLRHGAIAGCRQPTKTFRAIESG